MSLYHARKLLNFLIVFAIFAILAITYGKTEYNLGYYSSCMSIYTVWYHKLGIKDIDQSSLQNFCKKKTDER